MRGQPRPFRLHPNTAAADYQAQVGCLSLVELARLRIEVQPSVCQLSQYLSDVLNMFLIGFGVNGGVD